MKAVRKHEIEARRKANEELKQRKEEEEREKKIQDARKELERVCTCIALSLNGLCSW